MAFLISLWLPILLSGAALFFASFLAWTVLPHHNSELVKLPDEDGFGEAIRSMSPPPGHYMFPHCGNDKEAMKSEAFKQKMEQGPNGLLTIFQGPCNMGKNMFCTVVFFVGASFCIAYLSTLALQPGDNFMRVFRFIGTAGIMTYSAGGILNGIWFGRKMAMDILDGIVYGLITGAIFAVLWPGA